MDSTRGCHKLIKNSQKPNSDKRSNFDFHSLPVEDDFCNGKFDGFYDDPNDCTVFYQCLKGKASKRHCLRGMVFNALLKTCDTPQDFPCRTAEGTGTKQIENKTLEVKPSPRVGVNNDGGHNPTHLDSGKEMSDWRD